MAPPRRSGRFPPLPAILREELLNTELSGTVKAAREMTTAWRLEYNPRRPHGAVGYVPPAEYAARCQAAPGSATLHPTRPGSGTMDKTMVL